MRKKLVFLLALLTSVSCLLPSCEKVEDQPQEATPSPLKVRISPTIAKVTETQFERGDAIGVIIVLPTGVYASNARLEFDGTEFSGDLDWFDGASTCDIYAYYPYSADYQENFSVQADQSEGLSPSDYISGSISGVSSTANAVSMVFYHQMSRLEIQVTNNSGKQFADLKIGGLRPDSSLKEDPIEITPCLRNGNYYALVPTQRAALTLSFTLDGEQRTTEVPTSYFIAGKQHTVNLVLNPETGALAAITGEIDGWVDHGVVFPGNEDIYGILKEKFDNRDTYYFSRCYFFMSELRGDNVCQSGYSTDFFTHYMRYQNLENIPQIWPIMNRVIGAANHIIQKTTPWDAVSYHKMGEAYFFRAYSYFTQVTLYARHYSIGKDDDGFPLNTPEGTVTTTVSKVYDQVVEDLLQAIELMEGRDDPSKDHGYVTATAAKALLSRVYLYMERNDDCAALCDDLLGSAPENHLTADLPNYYKQARTDQETIWCIPYDSGDFDWYTATIGSMYYITDLSSAGIEGWGEFFWSDPLIELFKRYPGDLRFESFFVQHDVLPDGTKMIHWPIDRGTENRTDAVVTDVDAAADGSYTFTYDGESYTAQLKSKAGVNNGYPQYFIDYEGEETQVFVRDNVMEDWIWFRQGYVPYMMTKFSGQDGETNLSSPVILRWAEIILNRAEARAKMGDIDGALEDVNIIRRRAGLPDDAMMTTSNYRARGYESVLDVVLDERRMELCFEGHRYFDVYRNKKSMDRRYAGYNQWEVIDHTDSRIPYTIPMY